MRPDLAIQKVRLNEVAIIFGGSSRMSIKLGMAQPNFAKYIAGRRKVGPKIRLRLTENGVNPDYISGQSDTMFADNDAGQILAQQASEYTTATLPPNASSITENLPSALPDLSLSPDSHTIESNFHLHSQRIRLFCMTSDILPASLELLPMMEVTLQLGIPVDPTSTIAIRMAGSLLESERIFNNDIIVIEQNSTTGNSLLYSVNNLPAVYKSINDTPKDAILIGVIRIVVSYR